MKKNYYFTNKKNEQQFARASFNDYCYAIVYEFSNGERILACSSNKERLLKRITYYTRGYIARDHGLNYSLYWSDQFYDPNKIRIVELFTMF